jgi:hypothetical protein
VILRSYLLNLVAFALYTQHFFSTGIYFCHLIARAPTVSSFCCSEAENKKKKENHSLMITDTTKSRDGQGCIVCGFYLVGAAYVLHRYFYIVATFHLNVKMAVAERLNLTGRCRDYLHHDYDEKRKDLDCCQLTLLRHRCDKMGC